MPDPTSEASSLREEGVFGGALTHPRTSGLASRETRVPRFHLDIALPELILIVFQLGLAVLVVSQFQIESHTFYRVSKLILVGFVVHSVLPIEYRLPFFTGISVLSIFVALGVRDGMALLVGGTILIAICHLPIHLKVRIALLMTTGVVFAILRTGPMSLAWSTAVWPILGSMFMFRLVIYIYALRFEEERPTLTKAISYFFMIPNVCFALFPVVDYTTFYRSHYSGSETFDTYQRGMKWIVRGIVHLLLYRLIYMYGVTDAANVVDFADLVQHILATFLLYLRVSGQFHLIVGLLHLFGFRLPETHHLFYLASSFTDFWRRINIYWKDFMMKIFYYPAFFRLRARGNTTALVGSTLLVFFATWILHSYQWFWLRGGFPITLQDGLFWAILGMLVVVTALREARGRVRRGKPSSRWSLRRAATVSSVFVTICILWSLWSAESVSEWAAMWAVAPGAEPSEVVLICALAVLGFAIAGREWEGRKLGEKRNVLFFRKPAVQSLSVLVAILMFGQARLYAGPKLTSFVSTLRSNVLNDTDADLQQRGYYERLDNVSRMSAQLWDLQSQRPPSWVAFHATAASRKRSDFLYEDIQPSIETEVWDQPFTSNRWGMRDREYTLEKPPGTVRVALLGPSFLMGLGVGDGETFEAVLEERLNRLARGQLSSTRYELLNFGVGAYSLLQQMATLEDRALKFDPDIVVVMLPEDKRVSQANINHLVRIVGEGIAIPYPELKTTLRNAGIDFAEENSITGNLKVLSSQVARRLVARALKKLGFDSAVESKLERRIRAVNDPIVEWSLLRIMTLSREHGAVPVALGLDIVRGRPPDGTTALSTADRLGYVTIDMFDAYDGQDPSTLRLGVWDDHPNAVGHALIAERLYRELVAVDAQLGLNLRGSTGSR